MRPTRSLLRSARRLTVVAVVAALSTASATTAPPKPGRASTAVPQELRKVGFDQNLGERVPLDARFRDHTGAEVALGDLLGERPAILALVYYDCPMLCSLVLSGLTRNLRALEFDTGREFDVIAVSFDPTEGPAEAAGNRRDVLAAYGRPGAPERGWHFLTGGQEAIDRLTSSVGFRYELDQATGEYAHASGVVVLTPEGRAARYLFGVDFPARSLRLALVEASEGEIGSIVDQALLFCYRYDPKDGKYTTATLNLVRAGGVVTVLALALFLTLSWRRERASSTSAGGA